MIRLREPVGDPEPLARYTVRDCPDHPCCALEFPSGGILCLACGRAIGDTLAGPAPLPASPELLAEAKAAWLDSQAVRDFTASALEKNPQTGDDDGPQD